MCNMYNLFYMFVLMMIFLVPPNLFIRYWSVSFVLSVVTFVFLLVVFSSVNWICKHSLSNVSSFTFINLHSFLCAFQPLTIHSLLQKHAHWHPEHFFAFGLWQTKQRFFTSIEKPVNCRLTWNAISLYGWKEEWKRR